MKKITFYKILFLFFFISINCFAKDKTSIENSQWANLILMKGIEQRGGPFFFDDTYVEFEFGGRHEWLDLYGYVDFIDALNSKSSDKHGQNNFFVDIEPRISIDYLTNTDLSYGALQELYFAFDFYYADEPTGKGLKVLWMGLGSDIDIPWFGKSGVNFYTLLIHIRLTTFFHANKVLNMTVMNHLFYTLFRMQFYQDYFQIHNQYILEMIKNYSY